MTETNDYEKAKQECWEKYASAFDIQGSIPNEAFNWVFKRGYQLGKAHFQPANGLVNERLQVAAMAMQGILATGHSNSAGFIAEKAVRYADALLTELNKETP